MATSGAIAMATVDILPGHGIGLFVLGASLHYTLTQIKGNPQYPTINVAYSSDNPVSRPVVVELPDNGMRLRFDGPDQRLRLIEVLDFQKMNFLYEGHSFLKQDANSERHPTFRQIYNRTFGITYAGEYVPPASGETHGTYILSYPGIAFSFPFPHSSWSPERDDYATLASTSGSPAKSMAVFYPAIWKNARVDLFTRPVEPPRMPVLVGKDKEFIPDEIELVKVHGGGRIEFTRRSSPPVSIVLSETTAQDLVAEFGPPDATYLKNDHRISIHDRPISNIHNNSDNSDGDDAGDSPDDADGESDDSSVSPGDFPSTVGGECFYNYFSHGFDVLISSPTTHGPPFPGSAPATSTPTSSSPPLTVTKVLLHGNVPGSYPFNRHRRSRWAIVIDGDISLTSETPYSKISERLDKLWKGHYPAVDETAAHKGMVLNRGWGESPSSSVELLGSWEESSNTKPTNLSSTNDPKELGTTHVYGLPGLLFEVLSSGTISCLTIY